MSSLSIDSPNPRPTLAGSSNGGIVVATAIVVIACCLHAIAGRWGVAADTTWFTLSGIALLAVTVASHFALARPAAADADPLAAVTSLLLSMAIRLSGTFAVLGLLLWLAPLERAEAVFNVLFWYITLTATDLVALVRVRRRLEQASPARPRASSHVGESSETREAPTENRLPGE